MMLLDGHQKNTILMTNTLLEGKGQVVRRLNRKRVWLRGLVLSGMKHLVIIMMLLLGSTMMEIQVLFPSCFIFFTLENLYGINHFRHIHGKGLFVRGKKCLLLNSR